MYLTRQEENKNRVISSLITALVFGLLLLFLILYHLITPNPPFPSGGGGGQEFALGMMNVGNGNVEFGKMGNVNDVVVEKTPDNPAKEEKILTDENGENVNIKENKTETKTNVTVIKPVVHKEVVPEKTAAEKLAEKFKKNTGKNGGGFGDNEKEGDNGKPDGNPNTNGNGGTGGGTGGGNGTGDGPGDGPGKGPGFGGDGNKYGVSLKGRAVVNPPQLPKDTKEEGKVVVEITVNSEGKVIEANPNGRGTTTNSAILKQKAKNAAMATTFNVDGKFEEQKGTITIVFAFD